SIPLDENTYPVRIYDDVGRLVYSAAISGGPYIKIPTEDFARTFYMVTLQKEDRILSRKWIKL
ncbi:MAG: T9SS type A sorting domain-containing protein, partial [Bacteroidota bacterium]